MRRTLLIFLTLFAWLYEGNTTPYLAGWQPGMQRGGEPESTLLARPSVAITVVHDENPPRIIIRSWFYAAQNSPKELRQMRTAIQFWNDQSGRFAYRLGQGRAARDYGVHFELAEAPGYYNEANFFIPLASTNLRTLNQVQVIADQALARIPASHPEGQIAGYSPENFVYIAASHSDNLMVGIHEIGHRLGAGHAPGVMHCTLEHPTSYVATQTIREILATVGMLGRSKKGLELAHRYRPQAVSLSVSGTPPPNFFRAGKVIRK